MSMRIIPVHFLKSKLFFATMSCFFCLAIVGQDLEPRAYASVPKGINVLAFGYGVNVGNVLTDASLPVKDFKITTQILALNYIHSFGLAKKLARIQVSLPLADMHGKLKLNDEDVTGTRTGLADMRIRFGVNLSGSPALEKKDFRHYQEKTIFGLSFVTSVPTGKYYEDKMINIGNNRWAFKPEMGVSRRFKHVYAEAYLGTWFYTNNTEYMTNKVLKQKPTVTLQGHASYYFKNQIWVGLNTNWYKVGATTIDGVVSSDVMDDWRIGATFSSPISKTQSLRLQLHTGVLSNIGLNYDSVTLAYQHVF